MNFEPLKNLDADQLRELAGHSKLVNIRQGQSVTTLIDKEYIAYLLTGEVETAVGSTLHEKIKSNSKRSQQAIFTPENRVQMIAKKNSTILAVDGGLLDFIANWSDSGNLIVDEVQTDGDDWLDGLVKNNVVGNLPPSSLQVLITEIEPVEYKKNAVIFKQGEAAEYYYILANGRCVMNQKSSQGKPYQIATFNSGESFGEEVLLEKGQYNSQSTMDADGTILRLKKALFLELIALPLINTISLDDSNKKRSEGAVLLDVREQAAFMGNGKGVNIPFTTLRKNIPSLDSSKQYIVVSNDKNLTAAAVFLLNSQGFNSLALDSIVKTELKQQSAAISATIKDDKESIQLTKKIESLTDQLINMRLVMEKERTDFTKTKSRLQTLQVELKNRQLQSKQLLDEIEASNLAEITEFKTKFKSINNELILKKNDVNDLQISNKALKDQVNGLDDIISEKNQLKDQIQYLENDKHEIEQKLSKITEQSGNNETDFTEQKNNFLALLKHSEETVTSLTHELSQLKNSHTMLKGDKASLADTLGESSQSLDEIKNELSGLQSRYVILEDERSGLRSELDELNNAYQQIIDEKNEFKESLNEKSQSLEIANNKLSDLQQNKGKLEQETSHVNNEFDLLEKNYKALNDKHDTLQNTLGKQTQEFEKVNTDIYILQENHHVIEEEKNRLANELKSLSNKQDEVSGEINTLEHQLNEKNHNLNMANSELSNLQGRLDTSEEQYRDVIGEFELLTKKHTELESERTSQQLQLTDITQNLEASNESLTDLQQNHHQLKQKNNHTNDELELLTQEHTELGSVQEKLQQEFDTTTENFDAVQIILLELQKNHSSLEDEYIGKSNEIDTLSQAHSRLSHEQEALQQQYNETKQTLETTQTELSNLQENYSAIETQYFDKNSALEMLNSENDVLQKQYAETTKTLETSQIIQADLQGKHQEISSSLTDVKDELNVLTLSHDALTTEYQTSNNDLNVLNEKHLSLQQKYDNLEQQDIKLNNELDVTRDDLRLKNIQVSELVQDIDQANKRTEDTNNHSANLQEKTDGLDNTVKGLQQEKLSALSQVDELIKNKLSLEGEVKQGNDNYTTILSEKESVQKKLAIFTEMVRVRDLHITEINDDYAKQFTKIEKVLNLANQNADNSAKEAADLITQEQLRIKVLQEELNGLVGDNVRSGRFVKILVIVLLVIITVAYYMGVDLQAQVELLVSQANELKNQASPHINKLIDAIPK